MTFADYPVTASPLNQHEKQQLLELLVKQGIHYATPEHPIINRDGQHELRWVMNFLGISLQQPGLLLAARQILSLLEHFEGKQLATIGTAAVPLLTACVLLGAGKYTALMVRNERKSYGTGKLIDGDPDPAEPIIIIDDSIGSGHNMLKCIEHLESEGLTVEGGVCLVRFGYNSGFASVQEAGYHVESAFDVYRDLAPLMPCEPLYPDHPVKFVLQSIPWSHYVLPEKLSPYELVRQTIQYYLLHGKVLQAPNILKQTPDTRGGAWISLREQNTLLTRHARRGFWHFPGEKRLSASDDLVKAAYLVACELPAGKTGLELLQRSAIGITACGKLQACQRGDIKPSTDGIVLRSIETRGQMGGGLPNMPGISHTAHWLEHVRFNNAQLRPCEPFALYRHTIQKWVEPGVNWPAGGEPQAEKPWDCDPDIAGQMAQHLYQLVIDHYYQQDLHTLQLFIPNECEMIFASLYLYGQMRACIGLNINTAEDLKQLAEALIKDPRYLENPIPFDEIKSMQLRVSFLSETHYLGFEQGDAIHHQLVIGQDSLHIQYNQQQATLLAEVASQYHWNGLQFIQALYEKAGIDNEQSTHWWRSRTRTWLVLPDTPQQAQLVQANSFPQQTNTKLDLKNLAQQQLNYLCQHQQTDGALAVNYSPWLDLTLIHSEAEQWLITAQSCHQLARATLQSYAQADYANALQCGLDYLCETLLNTAWPDLENLAENEQVSYKLACAELLNTMTLVTRKSNQPKAQDLAKQLLAHINPMKLKPADILIGQTLLTAIKNNRLPIAQQEEILRRKNAYKRYICNKASESELPACLGLSGLWATLDADDEDWPYIVESLSHTLLSQQQPSGHFIAPASRHAPNYWTAQVVVSLQISRNKQSLNTAQTSDRAIQHALSALTKHILSPQIVTTLPNPSLAPGGILSGFANSLIETKHVLESLKALQNQINISNLS